MERGQGETGNFRPDNESSEINTERLSSRIATGIKMRLMDEATITYDNSEGKIGRDCFLVSRDGSKSLIISYWQSRDSRRSVDLTVIDRSNGSGYNVLLSQRETTIEFAPKVSYIPEDEIEDISEFTYRVGLHGYVDDQGNFRKGQYSERDEEYEQQMNSKENHQRGLLLIEDLLYNGWPDDDATSVAKDWFEVSTEDDERDKLINDLRINALLPTIASHVDESLQLLPQIVSNAFSPEDTEAQKGDD